MDMLEMLSKCKDDKTVAFPIMLSGKSNASNDKDAATVSMAFPRNVINKNLNDLDKWAVFVIAIDKNEYNRILNEVE